MQRFNENYQQVIDAKGRLQLSRDIRGEFGLKKGDHLYLLPGTGEQAHLEIRTQAQWEDFQTRLRQEAPSHMKTDFMRFIHLSKERVRADAQGRISIPKRLREICQLDGKVLVINMAFRIEVWNPSFVKARYNDFARAFQQLNDSLY